MKLTAILPLKIGPNCPKRKRVVFQPSIFNVNSLLVSGRVVGGWWTWRFPKKQRERCRKFLCWNVLFFFPITFPFMEIKATTKNYTPPFHDNKKTNGWIFLNGRGKTSEPHHQSFGLFEMFVFPVGNLPEACAQSWILLRAPIASWSSNVCQALFAVEMTTFGSRVFLALNHGPSPRAMGT